MKTKLSLLCLFSLLSTLQINGSEEPIDLLNPKALEAFKSAMTTIPPQITTLKQWLGLPLSATIKNIESKCRKLSLKYHPDKHPNSKEHTTAFTLLTDAKDLLIKDYGLCHPQRNSDTASNPLKVAIDNKDIEEVLRNIPYFKNMLNQIVKPDTFPTFFWKIIKLGDPEAVKIALENGADANQILSRGKTVFECILASKKINRNPQVKMLQECIKYGNLDESSKRVLSQHFSNIVALRNPPLVQYALKNGADANAKLSDGTPITHYVVSNTTMNLQQKKSILDQMIIAGANTGAQDAQGNTLCHLAAQVEGLERFVDLHPTIMNKNYQTPSNISRAIQNRNNAETPNPILTIQKKPFPTKKILTTVAAITATTGVGYVVVTKTPWAWLKKQAEKKISQLSTWATKLAEAKLKAGQFSC